MSIDGIRAVDKEPLAASDYLFGMSTVDGQRIGPRPVSTMAVAQQITALLPNGTVKTYTSVAAMNADTTPSIGTLAYAEGKTYRKTADTGSAGWEVFLDFIPGTQVVRAVTSGAGTANAVIATSSTSISATPGVHLINVGPFAAANGPGGMTLKINDGPVRAFVTNTGQPIPEAYVSGGMWALVAIDDVGNYRMYSYGDASAIQAVIEALLVSATAEADRAELAAGAVSSAPQWAFASKAAAALFDPAATPSFISMSGGDYANELGRAELFEVLPSATPDPVDLPAPAFVRLADGSLARWAGREFPLELGAKGDGLTDNSSFFEDLSGSMTGFDGVISAGRGQFKTKKPLLIPKHASLIGEGSSRTIVDAYGVADAGAFPDWAVVRKVGGAPVRIADLGLNAATGSRALVFASAHGLARDDLILIYNPNDYSYSPWRPVYRSGEYGVPREIASTDALYLDRGIYSDGEWSGVTNSGVEDLGTGGAYSTVAYNKDNVQVYECSGFGSGSVKGLTIRPPRDGANAGVAALFIQYIRGLGYEDVASLGGGANSMGIFNCYDVRGGRISARNEYALSGADYGLVIANSQKTMLSQMVLDGTRHAIAVGGANDFAIPCRDIHVSQSVLTSHGTGGVMCADWHGNVEYSSFTDLSLFGGGVNIAGNHNRVSGIRADSDTILVYGRELSGLDHCISDIRGRTTYNSVDNGIIDVGGSNITTLSELTARGGTLTLKDIEIEAPAQTGRLVLIRNRGFADSWFIDAHNVRVSAPNSEAILPAVIAIITVSGAPPLRLDVSNIRDVNLVSTAVMLGSEDGTTLVSGLQESGTVAVVASTSEAVADVIVTFARRFPKAPNVVPGPNVFSSGSGTDRIIVDADSVTATGFTFKFLTTSGSAFSDAGTLKGSWTATLDE